MISALPECREFWTHYNYFCALREILTDETEKRIVKKVRGLKKKDAERFLKSWLKIHQDRMKKNYIKFGDIDACELATGSLYKEFGILGIRIP